MPLEQELQTFHEQKEHLLEKYKDRYVLIKGDDIVADFESRGDALREGYKRFGHEAFLVKKVEEVEQVNFFSRPLAVSL
jgi:nicotinamide riboside kinase